MLSISNAVFSATRSVAARTGIGRMCSTPHAPLTPVQRVEIENKIKAYQTELDQLKSERESSTVLKIEPEVKDMRVKDIITINKFLFPLFNSDDPLEHELVLGGLINKADQSDTEWNVFAKEALFQIACDTTLAVSPEIRLEALTAIELSDSMRAYVKAREEYGVNLYQC